MSSGINEDNVQFQAMPIQLDFNEKNLISTVRKQNLAIIELQEYVTQMRNRIIALEEKVFN